MKTKFLIRYAFKNVINHKKNMLLIVLGIIISISSIFSINIWANTAQKIAITDFLQTQDYQSYVLSSQPELEINNIMTDLSQNSLVENYDQIFKTQAVFNIGNKTNFYECLPENEQEDQENPVSITNAFIASEITLERTKHLFTYDGTFSTENNSLIISYNEAKELEEILDRELTIGDQLNLSIAKYQPTPSYGQNTLGDFELTHYSNYTINGFYKIKEGVSIIQAALDIEWLADSIIFPLSSISPVDKSTLVDNKIPLLLLVQFNINQITSDGFENIVPKMELFSENIKADYPYAYIYLLSFPITSLLSSYSRASTAVVFLFPVVVLGIILTIFMIDIFVESRSSEISLLRDRGAEKKHIIFMFVIEFFIISIIGLIIGVILSLFLSALIPSFTTFRFDAALYYKFLTNITIKFGFLIMLIISTLVIVIGYALIKIWRKILIREKESNKEEEAYLKTERNILLGLNIGFTLIVLLALIFSIINTIKGISGSNNYSMTTSSSAGYTFILLSLLLIFATEAFSFLLMNKAQGSLKPLYSFIIAADALFLVNNFKRKNKRLNIMTFALLFLSSIVIFSLVISHSLQYNEQLVYEFNQGADFRINTYPINYSFKSNISEIEGIDQVASFLKTTGTVSYDQYTVYGCDASLYGQVGRWVKSSFPEGNSLENLYDLNSTYNGIIISPKLADNLELQIGDRLPITDLPGGIYYRQFVIVGFLESAPGLGLMEGANIELFQENQGIILMNNKYMANELKVVNSPLFLASMKKEGNKQVITNEIKELLPEATVNPTQINEDFVGTFIETYVPKAQIFFWISLGTTLLLGAILLIMITDFVLYQRLQEYAIKRVLGLSKKRIIRLILIEILVISLSVSVIGVALGLSFTYSTFNIIIPIITAHNIIPIEISIPLWQVFLFPIIIIFFAVIDVFPLIFKHSNKKIISSLYQ